MIKRAMNAVHFEREEFLSDVMAGLSGHRKTLLPKYFYDHRGSELFNRICEQNEYYLTRAEETILGTKALREIARRFGRQGLIAEFGPGSPRKISMILEAFNRPAGYIPVEISPSALRETVDAISSRFPGLDIVPIQGDFTDADFLRRDTPELPAGRGTLGMLLGSTIGNFHPPEAAVLLKNLARWLGPGALFLIGVDLAKPEPVLEAAYNDQAGVTAAFNLNLLSRINRELGADFNLEAFEHHAYFNREHSRVEMHLVAREEQEVSLRGGNIRFEFARGESIHTENSYKYTPENFSALARSVGPTPEVSWTDPEGLYCLQLFRV